MNKEFWAEVVASIFYMLLPFFITFIMLILALGIIFIIGAIGCFLVDLFSVLGGL